MRCLIGFGLLLALSPTPLYGQGTMARPRASVLFIDHTPPSAWAADTTRTDTGIKESTGGLIGAGLGGLAGYATVELIGSIRRLETCPDLFADCRVERPSTGMFILGSVVGSVAGYLVGSALARN